MARSMMGPKGPPQVRVLWESADHRYRLAAREWAARGAPSYGGMIWWQGAWRWCGNNREDGAVLRAVAAWMDQQRHQGDQAEQKEVRVDTTHDER